MICGACNYLWNGATPYNKLLPPYMAILLLRGGEATFIGKHDVGWVGNSDVLLHSKLTFLINSIAILVGRGMCHYH